MEIAHPRTAKDAATFQALFLLCVAGLLLLGSNSQAVLNLATVFAGIVLEALPFMLLGSLVGGVIEVYVSRERLIAKLPRKSWQVVLAAASLGILCPICECAVVPVVRRLLRKGIPVPAAIAFLLGAPMVNPVVGMATAVAYTFSIKVALIRLLIGYLIAVTAGLMVGRFFPADSALAHGTVSDHEDDCGCGHCHCADDHPHHQRRGLIDALRHASGDFFEVGHFLVIGAFIAALCQTLVSRQSFVPLASSPLIAIFLMMLLAVGLNICSQADAFIAASFRNIIPFPAQMAFMLLGPMLDLKLIFMFTGVFRKKAILVLAGTVATLVFLSAYLLNVFLPGIQP